MREISLLFLLRQRAFWHVKDAVLLNRCVHALGQLARIISIRFDYLVLIYGGNILTLDLLFCRLLFSLWEQWVRFPPTTEIQRRISGWNNKAQLDYSKDLESKYWQVRDCFCYILCQMIKGKG